eukprot:scaffold8360_cov122-Isochrysis_galbana.AAC.2
MCRLSRQLLLVGQLSSELGAPATQLRFVRCRLTRDEDKPDLSHKRGGLANRALAPLARRRGAPAQLGLNAAPPEEMAARERARLMRAATVPGERADLAPAAVLRHFARQRCRRPLLALGSALASPGGGRVDVRCASDRSAASRPRTPPPVHARRNPSTRLERRCGGGNGRGGGGGVRRRCWASGGTGGCHGGVEIRRLRSGGKLHLRTGAPSDGFPQSVRVRPRSHARPRARLCVGDHIIRRLCRRMVHPCSAPGRKHRRSFRHRPRRHTVA